MEPRKNSIKERSKKIPLDIRIYVDQTFEWYKLNIKEKRFHTLEEEEEAHKWATKRTENIIAMIEKWQADGAELKSKKTNG